MGLVVRALYLLTVEADWFVDPIVDADMLDAQGELVAAGVGLPPGVFWQPPTYPLLLGTIYRVVGHAMWAPRALQALAGAATCGLVTSLTRRVLEDRRLALAAGLLCALHGPLVFYTGELLPTTLGTFLVTLAVHRAAAHDDAGTADAALQSGLCAGLATITLPAVFPATFAIAWLVARRAPAASSLDDAPHPLAPRLRAPVTLAAALLAIAPVTIANHARSGEWVAVSANAGVNLWVGNNPSGDRLELVRPGPAWDALMDEVAADGATSLVTADRAFARRALRYCATQPIDCAAGALRKARLLLASRELPRNESLAVARRGSLLLAALTAHVGSAHLPYALLLPLSIAGLAFIFAPPGPSRSLVDPIVARGVALTALLLAVTPLVFFVTGRYRAPMAPMLCVTAAIGWAALVARSRLPSALAIATFVLAIAPVQVATDTIDFDAETRTAVDARRARRARHSPR